MTNSNDSQNQYLVSFSDLLRIFKRNRKKIFYWAAAFGMLGIIFALTRPVRYEAEGTFREKGVKLNNMPSPSIMQLISGGVTLSNESEAASLMASRKILQQVIEKLHLQANLTALSDVEKKSTFVKHNLQLAWAALFRKSPEPVLKDRCCPLKIDKLQFDGEIPLSLKIILRKNGSYEVHRNGLVGEGKLGEPFAYGELSMVLAASEPDKLLAEQPFSLTVDSLPHAAQELCKIMKVETTKLDKGLLKLKCEHRDRHLASSILNETMESYQNYLKNYHLNIALNQLEYLHSRRDQLTDDLTTLMHRHADFLSNDLHHTGLIDSDKEMDFLAKSQHEYKQKLLDNELEIKRLTSIKPGNLAYYDRYASNDGDPAVINSTLSEMRTLKQQRDGLEIELQKKGVHQGLDLQLSFEQQLKELQEVQHYLADLHALMEQFRQGKEPNPQLTLFNDPRFLLKGWFERLEKAKRNGLDDLKETQENFQHYLNNLERLFGVHERILQERITHQQNPSEEYQGISLEVATNLYLDYSKQQIQMEANIRQNLFFIHQIEDPHFEITSLSGGLEDSVSNSIINKSSELILNLRDENNQSSREQERIKDDLNLQRTFLTLHLKQMVQLMELNKQLINEKIFALQNVSLELIHQRISLLEKNLQEYLKSRLDNLQQERTLLQRHLDGIHAEMAILPQKWVSEQLVTQEVETNQKIVEEIAKLVESKNISHKLDVIQSAPVDVSIAPVHPMPPKLFLFGALGFLLGGCLGSAFVLGKAFRSGIELTQENLTQMGYHVSGELQKGNLEPLRRLQTYFDTSSSSHHSLLFIDKPGSHNALDLATLFAHRGKRVIVLDLNLSEPSPSKGLLQYLKGEMATPSTQHLPHYDLISAGGEALYAVELLHSPLFQKLVTHLKKEYYWIIATTTVKPCSIEAESLLSLFQHVAVTLTNEKVDDLDIYQRFLTQSSDHQLTFLLIS